MAFPTFSQHESSEFIPESGVVLDRSMYGGTTARNPYQSRDPGVFRIVYRGLTSSELGQLNSNYDSNRATVQTFTWNGDSPPTSHNVYWLEPPQWERDGPWYHAVCLLVKDIEYGSLIQTNGDNLTLTNGDDLLLAGGS